MGMIIDMILQNFLLFATKTIFVRGWIRQRYLLLVGKVNINALAHKVQFIQVAD